MHLRQHMVNTREGHDQIEILSAGNWDDVLLLVSSCHGPTDQWPSHYHQQCFLRGSLGGSSGVRIEWSVGWGGVADRVGESPLPYVDVGVYTRPVASNV